MKKLLVASMALGIMCIAGSAAAKINGTPHWISGTGYAGGPSTGEPCAYCHTPHGAYTGNTGGTAPIPNAPLWDHQQTLSSFTPYTDYFDTMDANIPAVGALPNGVSKACLSCHDGTVAVDSYHQAVGGKLITGGAALIGTDLSNDHPVSIVYAEADALDAEIEPAANVQDLLLAGKVECGSCHDVHNAGFNKFLIQTNVGSALCLRCHIK